MGFVDDNGKPLFLQAGNAVHDVRELLNCGRYNFRIAVQRNGKIGRIAFIIHDADKPGFMLHAHDGFLKLTVHHDSVGDNHDIVKDDLIVRIMKRS